ncbi:hypothetical protein PUN28_005935 [Cardiocondyla obscurior]|uniref:Uncharacterized protein n=1 Tax=Cardiocondyla obscurior TaxID=286306 RepID=A0AAW2GCF7_9HYME
MQKWAAATIINCSTSNYRLQLSFSNTGRAATLLRPGAPSPPPFTLLPPRIQHRSPHPPPASPPPSPPPPPSLCANRPSPPTPNNPGNPLPN